MGFIIIPWCVITQRYTCYSSSFIIIIKRRSGINPIPPMVIDRD